MPLTTTKPKPKPKQFAWALRLEEDQPVPPEHNACLEQRRTPSLLITHIISELSLASPTRHLAGTDCVVNAHSLTTDT